MRTLVSARLKTVRATAVGKARSLSAILGVMVFAVTAPAGAQTAADVYRGMLDLIQRGDIRSAERECARLEASFAEDNATGCAVLDLALAQAKLGNDVEAQELLRRAIDGYSECRFDMGVEVGPYATYTLASLLETQGNPQDAKALFERIIYEYPFSIDEHGFPLANLARRHLGPAEPAPALPRPKASFALRDVYGREVRASDYAGVPLLLEFGACWCGGCQQEAHKLGEIAAEYAPRGLRTIRFALGDDELAALEFQKHYRLPVAHLLDLDSQVERTYNERGWPFVMVADASGDVVFSTNVMLDKEEPGFRQALEGVLANVTRPDEVERDGISYMRPTLARSGETERARGRDWFPSIACASDGRIYVVFTRDRDAHGDVFLRVFDGTVWSEDYPVAATEADEYDGTVLVDRDDRVWVSWTGNPDGRNYSILVTSFTDPSGIPGPTQITQHDDDAMHARMACDAGGNVWIAYYKWHRIRSVSRDKELYVRRHSGGIWSDEVAVSPPDVPFWDDHFDPAIAAYRDGVVVSWSWDFHPPEGYTGAANRPTIFLRTIGPDFALGSPRTVSGGATDTAPTVAVGPNDRIWCAWSCVVHDEESGLGRHAVYLASPPLLSAGMLGAAGMGRDPSAVTMVCTPDSCLPVPGGARLSGSAASASAGDVCTPTFAVAPSGRVTLVWSECDTEEVWLLKRADLEPGTDRWSPPQVIDREANARFPAAAYDGEGALWIAYSGQTAAGQEVLVRGIAADTPR